MILCWTQILLFTPILITYYFITNDTKLGHLKQFYFVHNFVCSSSLFLMGLRQLNRAGESTFKLFTSMASQLVLADGWKPSWGYCLGPQHLFMLATPTLARFLGQMFQEAWAEVISPLWPIVPEVSPVLHSIVQASLTKLSPNQK